MLPQDRAFWEGRNAYPLVARCALLRAVGSALSLEPLTSLKLVTRRPESLLCAVAGSDYGSRRRHRHGAMRWLNARAQASASASASGFTSVAGLQCLNSRYKASSPAIVEY